MGDGTIRLRDTVTSVTSVQATRRLPACSASGSITSAGWFRHSETAIATATATNRATPIQRPLAAL